MIIGICGKSGSGKSTLAKRIMNYSDKEALHLEIDKVGHQVLLLPEVRGELVEAFGEGVLKDDYVDRKRLGDIVFASREEMAKLTEITWKYMQIEIDKVIESNPGKLIILDWILLPQSKYFEMSNIKVLLDIPYEIRKSRAIKRDGISEEAFDLRDSASIEYDSDSFDFVIKKEEDYKRLEMIL